MLKKILKITWIAILALIVLATGFYAYAWLDIESRIHKTYSVAVESVDVRYDSASIIRGERLSRVRACKECHGTDLGGTLIFKDPLIGTFVSRNITKGKGGLPDDFSEEDWVLAMKHGLNRNRQPLLFMPSHELSQLSESEMSAIIAYCSQIPKVDRESPPIRLGPLGYVLSEFNLIPLLPAEFTNHKVAFAKEVQPEISVEYGKYMATMCVNCHGSGLKGGESPVPGGKFVADISATGNPGKWSHEEFASALQTGTTPEGKILDPKEMPWTITKSFTKEELTALHMYLLTLK